MLKSDVSIMKQDIFPTRIVQKDHGNRLDRVEKKVESMHSDIVELYGVSSR